MLTYRQTVEALRADFARNEFAGPRFTLAVWRFGQAVHGRPGPAGFALRRVHSVVDQVWTRGVIGAELPRSVAVGPGLRLPHCGRGVILHPDTRIGAGVTLYHQVTVGVRANSAPPVIGDDVYIGCGAKILGAVTVGRGGRIGANAVVLTDVGEDEAWVGVPARAATRRPPAEPATAPSGTADLAGRVT